MLKLTAVRDKCSVCKSMCTVWREVVKWPYFHITCFLVLSSVI